MATVTLALALLFGASQTSLDQREREASTAPGTP